MGKWSKGPATARQNDRGQWNVVAADGPIINGHIFECPQEAADAALIADAFSVAHETGRTPRQLAGERVKLLARLRDAAECLEHVTDNSPGMAHYGTLELIRAAIADAEGATP